MTHNEDRVNQLEKMLNLLLRRQDDFSREIENLRHEINRLKVSENKQIVEKEEISHEMPNADQKPLLQAEEVRDIHQPYQQQNAGDRPVHSYKRPTYKLKFSLSTEKFIGENLISKIGIIVTVIGVSIGAKYTIDNNLITPLMRIVLGYLIGAALLGIGLKLKRKYENYSAVLVSGAMAIMYFITFAAYTFYGLFPEVVAFGLMFIFTAFAVLASMTYNNQIIAVIGLVGAYAVPFLLGFSSEKILILFTYMSIINVGILVIAFKKYWKPLYYFSFGLTWLIFLSWYASKYQTNEHLALALSFLTIFFITFYLTFLGYKVLRKEKFEIDDIFLLLANSFIFFGAGYDILDNHETGKNLLGIFTLCNAIVHFIVSVLIYRQKLVDRNLFYLISGLVMVFITVAIPVQLDGNWVTLLWVGEAALLFWIGRTKNSPIFERLSYPLMILAFFSLYFDWMIVYDAYNPENPETRLIPFININFLTSLIFMGCFVFINILNSKKEYTSAFISQKEISRIISYVLPAILIITIYYSFRLEIANYFHQLFLDSNIVVNFEGEDYADYSRNYNLKWFKVIWIINYSLLFVSILSFVNIMKIRSRQLGIINLGLIAVTIIVFLFQGLYALSELRESYLGNDMPGYNQSGVFNMIIRYVSFVFVVLSLFVAHRCIVQFFISKKIKMAYDILLYFSALWIISSELINLMDLAGSTQSYKLGLSILWGVYSLFLIVMGIFKKKKYLRIGAIILFGITFIKLFLYDISHLGTIKKAILFVSLGIILLIISFLYNKYKYLIFDESEK